jgi:hypothetical protein
MNTHNTTPPSYIQLALLLLFTILSKNVFILDLLPSFNLSIYLYSNLAVANATPKINGTILNQILVYKYLYAGLPSIGYELIDI